MRALELYRELGRLFGENQGNELCPVDVRLLDGPDAGASKPVSAVRVDADRGTLYIIAGTGHSGGR